MFHSGDTDYEEEAEVTRFIGGLAVNTTACRNLERLRRDCGLFWNVEGES